MSLRIMTSENLRKRK